MMLMRRLAVTAILGAILLGCGGCLVVAAGAGAAGAVAYVKGETKSHEQASLDRTWEAAQVAMGDLQFSTISKQKDALSGKLIARTAEDKKIQIIAQRISDTMTAVHIRVEYFGNDVLSRQILDAMRKHY